MVYDVLIIGSGPAGLTAGIYAVRAGLRTVILAGEKWGGQLMLTTNVENYPGFVDGILGPDLMANMRKQAERLGVVILDRNATKVDFSNKPFKIYGDNEEFAARSVIVATGAETVWLGVPGEEKLIGHGVSSCAPCDAFFFKNKKVIVVGGGDSAMEEALVLSKFASGVTIVHRRDAFRASKIMQEKVLSLSNVSVVMNSTVEEILGEGQVMGVRLKNVVTGAIEEELTDGVFVAIGHKPMTDMFKNQIEVDQKGYIVRKEIKDKDSGLLKYRIMTSVPGVFVAGDVADYHYRQAVTAAAFGCMAALEAEKWLSEN